MSSSSDDISTSIFVLNDSKIWQQIDNSRIFRWISWWLVEWATQSQIFWNCMEWIWLGNGSIALMPLTYDEIMINVSSNCYIRICAKFQDSQPTFHFLGTSFADKHWIPLWKIQSSWYFKSAIKQNLKPKKKLHSELNGSTAKKETHTHTANVTFETHLLILRMVLD